MTARSDELAGGPWTPRRLGGSFVALVVCELALVCFFLISPALLDGAYYGPRSGTGYAYWYLVFAAFIPYGFALRSFSRGHRLPCSVLLGTAAVLYIALIPAPAQQSQDVYQSLLYGKMALHGANPYLVYASSLHDPWQAWSLWSNTLSVYGPLWTILNASVVAITFENLSAAFIAMKCLMCAMAIVTVWVLSRVAARSSDNEYDHMRSDSGLVVLAFAFNPLILFSVGVGAHPDIALACGIACAILADRTGRPWVTSLFLAAAVLVKAYAVFVLLVWLVSLARKRGPRVAGGHALGSGAFLVLGYAVFWGGLRTFDSLLTIERLASASLVGSLMRVTSGHLNDASAAGGAPVSAVIRVFAAIVFCLIAINVVRSPRTPQEPWRAAAILLGGYLLLTPWFLPWHLTGLLVLAIVVNDDLITWPAFTFSASALIVGGGVVLQVVLRYAPPFVVAGGIMRRRKADTLIEITGKPQQPRLEA